MTIEEQHLAVINATPDENKARLLCLLHYPSMLKFHNNDVIPELDRLVIERMKNWSKQ
jgi:hypothetical protein